MERQLLLSTWPNCIILGEKGEPLSTKDRETEAQREIEMREEDECFLGFHRFWSLPKAWLHFCLQFFKIHSFYN